MSRDRIKELQDQNAASRDEIARRQEQRAANFDFEEETPTIQKFNDNETLVFKTTETAADDWEKWLAGHLANERSVLTEAIGELVAHERRAWRAEIERRDANLEKQIAELRGKVEALTEMLKMRLYKS